MDIFPARLFWRYLHDYFGIWCFIGMDHQIALIVLIHTMPLLLSTRGRLTSLADLSDMPVSLPLQLRWPPVHPHHPRRERNLHAGIARNVATGRDKHHQNVPSNKALHYIEHQRAST